MKVDVLLGLQWGDEGKGKIVDHLAPQYQMVARFQGGPNAGHTLVINDKKFVLHTIPSGIFHDGITNLIGNGVVVNPITLRAEIEGLIAAGVPVLDNLVIARKAHLITPGHLALDAASEHAKGKDKIGSTLRGIGPTYMDKTGRNGLRFGDTEKTDFQAKYNGLKDKHNGLLEKYYEGEFKIDEETEKEWFAAIDFLKQVTKVDGEFFVNQFLNEGKKVLAEGAQGSMLDIDYGTYPFVTSSNTITAGACIGLGVSPDKIGEVIGITKIYCTRVGNGPFPTALENEIGEKIQTLGGEFGATTGRVRQCGWIDLVALQYTCMISGVTQLAVTKVDVLNDFETIGVCDEYTINGKAIQTLPYEIDDSVEVQYKSFKGWQQHIDAATSYDDLPENLLSILSHIEQFTNAKVTMVSNGPERENLILR